jgi:hypothetical protein
MWMFYIKWLLFSIQTWTIFLSVRCMFYVNVTSYDCCFQYKHEQSSVNVYVNVTCLTVVSIIYLTNLQWDECLCECYIIYDCCFQYKHGKCSVRWMFMWMLHHNMTVVFFNTNMENVQWDECLCECYIIIWLLFSSIQTWKMFSEMNVYVNVTFYDCCSQNKHEQSSVRWMFMWMLHHMVVLKTNMNNLQWDACLCEWYIIWPMFSIQAWKIFIEMNVYMWMLHHIWLLFSIQT